MPSVTSHITELQRNGNGEWRFVCSCGYVSTPVLTKEEALTEISRHDFDVEGELGTQ